MSNIHLDLNELVGQIQRGQPNPTPTGTGYTHIRIEDKQATPWDRIGPAQRESLLAFIVSPKTDNELAHADGDNIVYDALGSHRILGESKKRKGRITSTTKIKPGKELRS